MRPAAADGKARCQRNRSDCFNNQPARRSPANRARGQYGVTADGFRQGALGARTASCESRKILRVASPWYVTRYSSCSSRVEGTGPFMEHWPGHREHDCACVSMPTCAPPRTSHPLVLRGYSSWSPHVRQAQRDGKPAGERAGRSRADLSTNRSSRAAAVQCFENRPTERHGGERHRGIRSHAKGCSIWLTRGRVAPLKANELPVPLNLRSEPRRFRGEGTEASW
jgi:hypothetical protein